MVSYVTYVSASLCIVLGLYLSKKWSYGSTQAYPYPPGPKGLPILGNLFDMMATRDCKALQSLRDTYGGSFHIDSEQSYWTEYTRSYCPPKGLWKILYLFEWLSNNGWFIRETREYILLSTTPGHEWLVSTITTYIPITFGESNKSKKTRVEWMVCYCTSLWTWAT